MVGYIHIEHILIEHGSVWLRSIVFCESVGIRKDMYSGYSLFVSITASAATISYLRSSYCHMNVDVPITFDVAHLPQL